MKKTSLVLFVVVLLITGMVANKPETIEASERYAVCPIGRILKSDGKTLIILAKEYQEGLLGLEDFSHVYVLYWFNGNDTPAKRSILQVHPRGDLGNPLTGVFATRAPVRPNLIALSLCRILSIKGNVVDIDEIDAHHDTPVLDLKPYLPNSEPTDVSFPSWVEHR